MSNNWERYLQSVEFLDNWIFVLCFSIFPVLFSRLWLFLASLKYFWYFFLLWGRITLHTKTKQNPKLWKVISLLKSTLIYHIHWAFLYTNNKIFTVKRIICFFRFFSHLFFGAMSIIFVVNDIIRFTRVLFYLHKIAGRIFFNK